MKLFTTTLILVIVFAATSTFGQSSGWMQQHGGAYRNRNSPFDKFNLKQNYHAEFNISLSSPLLFATYHQNFYALGYPENAFESAQSLYEISNNFVINSVKIPNGYPLITWVAPVVDDDANFYSVRVNQSNGVYFVLKTSMSTKTNTILFDTESKSAIENMVLTDYGLIVVSNNFIVSVDAKTGNGKWIVNDIGSAQDCQILNFLYTLYVLTKKEIIEIRTETGSVSARYNFANPLILNYYQPLLIAVGPIIVADRSNGHNLLVFSGGVIDKGPLSTFKFNSLDHCSNIIGLPYVDNVASFAMVCHNTDSNSYTAYKFNVISYQISLAYAINTNSLFGIPPKVCSLQIASYGNPDSYYGMACDVGLISFHKNGTIVPRRQIDIPVTANTQVFGTVTSFALATNVCKDGKCKLSMQSIDIQ